MIRAVIKIIKYIWIQLNDIKFNNKIPKGNSA